MNLSGESVRELIDYYKIAEDELIVIYMDNYPYEVFQALKLNLLSSPQVFFF